MGQGRKSKATRVPEDPAKTKGFTNAVALLVVAAVLSLLGGIALYEYERPRPSAEQVLTDIPTKAHTFSLISGGRTVSGESTAPFEKGSGYFARVEACERFGVEGLMTMVSCYLTIKPTVNLVISNSENLTEARYTDGTPAKICCMLFEDGSDAPIYRIKIPSGVERRTVQRGSEVHITLNIPNADPEHDLDAIRFSPGEGVAPVLFPVKGAMRDHILSASFIQAHRADPHVQSLVADGYRMKAEAKAAEEKNRGLTYEP